MKRSHNCEVVVRNSKHVRSRFSDATRLSKVQAATEHSSGNNREFYLPRPLTLRLEVIAARSSRITITADVLDQSCSTWNSFPFPYLFLWSCGCSFTSNLCPLITCGLHALLEMQATPTLSHTRDVVAFCDKTGGAQLLLLLLLP